MRYLSHGEAGLMDRPVDSCVWIDSVNHSRADSSPMFELHYNTEFGKRYLPLVLQRTILNTFSMRLWTSCSLFGSIKQLWARYLEGDTIATKIGSGLVKIGSG